MNKCKQCGTKITKNIYKSYRGLCSDRWCYFFYYNKPINSLIVDAKKIGEKMKQINDEIVEELAELEHQQWSHWTDHLLSNQNVENVARWMMQIETPYKDLSEKEKESDREWAKKAYRIATSKLIQEFKVLVSDNLENDEYYYFMDFLLEKEKELKE
ncbi:MAG: hypothetical protein AABY22_09700 [Nanoarchaeota archaeon]